VLFLLLAFPVNLELREEHGEYDPDLSTTLALAGERPSSPEFLPIILFQGTKHQTRSSATQQPEAKSREGRVKKPNFRKKKATPAKE